MDIRVSRECKYRNTNGKYLWFIFIVISMLLSLNWPWWHEKHHIRGYRLNLNRLNYFPLKCHICNYSHFECDVLLRRDVVRSIRKFFCDKRFRGRGQIQLCDIILHVFTFHWHVSLIAIYFRLTIPIPIVFSRNMKYDTEDFSCPFSRTNAVVRSKYAFSLLNRTKLAFFFVG